MGKHQVNTRTASKDDPSTAPESGDPQDSGRSRGQVVGPADDTEATDKSNGTGEEFESGRQDAAPRAGRT